MNLKALLDEIRILKRTDHYGSTLQLKAIKETVEAVDFTVKPSSFITSKNIRLWQQIKEELKL